MLNRRHALALLATPALAPVRAAELRDDLRIAGDALRALHPGLTRYQSPAAFEAHLHRLEPEFLQRPALALTRLTAGLHCGHSYLNFYNQRGAVREQMVTAPPRLPLHFDWLAGDAAVVLRAAPGVDIAPGSELLAVNGVPLPLLREELLTLTRGDGQGLSSRAARLALLAPKGDDEFETFDVLHPLRFGASPRWRLLLRDARGRRFERELEGISHAQRLAMRPAPEAEPSDATPPWPLQRLEGGRSACLRMPGWALYRSRWDWRAYLDRVMDQLIDEGVSRLVIDLRGNEGGLDCGDALLERLIERPLPAPAYERRLRFQQVPAALNPYLDTWDDSFRDWRGRSEALGDGWWRLPAASAPDLQPRGRRFRGQLRVLMDGSNASATFGFLLKLRAAGLGATVGSPSGGNLRGINGGAFFFLRLPASGIELDVPLIGQFPLQAQPDAGLLPDIAVRATAADVAAGRDPVLAAALVS